MQGSAPERQFPTAAAEFWFKLHHGAAAEGMVHDEVSTANAARQLSHASPATLRQSGQEVDGDSDEEEEAVLEEQHPGMGLPPSAAAMQDESGRAEKTTEASLAVKDHKEAGQCQAYLESNPGGKQQGKAEGGGQQQPSRALPVQAPAWASDRARIWESELQRFTHGTAMVDQHSMCSPASSTLSRAGMEQGLIISAETDSDSDDDDLLSHEGNQSSQQPFAPHLQGKEGIRRFMARLHKPKNAKSKQPMQQHRPLLLKQQPQQQQQQELQQQSLMQPSLEQQHTALQHSGLSTKPSLLHHAANPTDISRKASEHSEGLTVSSQQGAAADSQAQSALEASLLHAAVGVGVSPVEAAVSAVVGRLQSVQLGLASAEDRLALLTGRRAAKR